VTVVQGSGKLEFKDDIVVLEAGDSLLIPAHTAHRVASTSSQPPCVWLCVFLEGQA